MEEVLGALRLRWTERLSFCPFLRVRDDFTVTKQGNRSNISNINCSSSFQGEVSIVTNERAWVTPLQGWTHDGLANVLELLFPPAPTNTPIMTHLEVRSKETHTISRSDYPMGVVLIPDGDEPQDFPAVLPLVNATEDEVPVPIGGDSANPNGVVVLFKSS